MRRKFRIISLLLAISILLASCGTKSTNEDNKNEPSKNTNTSETKVESVVETTSENGNNFDQTDEVDLNAYILSLKENKENRPFYVKLISKRTISEDEVGGDIDSSLEQKYDGKTLLRSGRVGGLDLEAYSLIENGQLINYAGLKIGEDTMYYKSIDPSTQSIGLDLIDRIDPNDLDWKLDSVNGSIQVYKATIGPNLIEKMLSTPEIILRNVKGNMYLTLSYDKNKEEIVEFETNLDYEGTTVVNATPTTSESESGITEKINAKYFDFRFDNIETIVIPQEALNAEDIGSLRLE